MASEAVSLPLFALDIIAACAAERAAKGFVSLETLYTNLSPDTTAQQANDQARRLAQMFNANLTSQKGISRCAANGDLDAANLAAWMQIQGIFPAPCTPLAASRAAKLERDLIADPEAFFERADQPYPFACGGSHCGIDPIWARDLLRQSLPRLEEFNATRRGDTAVLVGNGPSLQQTNLDDLRCLDVYISNYAINHPKLAKLARGLAVTNFLVADQAPEVFFDLNIWRVFPVGLSQTLADNSRTIWLNAVGGDLFFSTIPSRQIAWHATVSFFWMQVLLAAGYKKLLLIGFDNSYQQPASLCEGDLVKQIGADTNHFDPSYFRGKVWQAADTGHMAQSYLRAKFAFEQAGAEIVNCTVGGALAVFRRASLAAELARA